MTLTWAAVLDFMSNGIGGDLTLGKVILSKAPVTEARETVLADFTAPDYAGYAPSSIATWSAPYIDPENVARVDGGDHLFVPTSGLTPNLIYGWGITNTAGTSLLAVHSFDTPVALDDAMHGLEVHVTLPYGA